jgi:hypothetical protein
MSRTQKCREKKTSAGGKGKSKAVKLKGEGIKAASAATIIKLCQEGFRFDAKKVRERTPVLKATYLNDLAIATAIGQGAGEKDQDAQGNELEPKGFGLWHDGRSFYPTQENAILVMKDQWHRIDELALECGCADRYGLMEMVLALPTRQAWEDDNFHSSDVRRMRAERKRKQYPGWDQDEEAAEEAAAVARLVADANREAAAHEPDDEATDGLPDNPADDAETEDQTVADEADEGDQS